MRGNKLLAAVACFVWIVIACIAVVRLHDRHTQSAQLPPIHRTSGLDYLEEPLHAPGVSTDLPAAVAFQLAPADRRNSWLLTYTNGGHTARLIVRLFPQQTRKSPGDIPVESGRGLFESINGSDPSTLIPALHQMLQAKTNPTDVRHLQTVPFTYAILGDHRSKSPSRGFVASPPGDWTAMKIFIGDDNLDDPGEFYFNLDPVAGQAEFSIKDADYGDDVFRNLLAILQPTAKALPTK